VYDRYLRIPAVHTTFARQVGEAAEYHGEYHHFRNGQATARATPMTVCLFGLH
jgi:hypothetical protein